MSSALDVRSDQNEGSVASPGNVMPLHHVDSLHTHAGSNIGDGRVTAIAQNILNYDPEAQVWQDSPSLSLMLSSICKWVIFVLVWLGALSFLSPAPSLPKAETAQPVQTAVVADNHAHGKKGSRARGKAASAAVAPTAAPEAAQTAAPGKDNNGNWYHLVLAVGVLIIAYQIYSHCVWALRLKNIKYKMSSQRLMVESGIFSKTSNTYELHNLGSTGQIQSPFFPRLFGRSNLYVGLWLSGIRNAEAVRDLIRNAGQIEASRVEKARFR